MIFWAKMMQMKAFGEVYLKPTFFHLYMKALLMVRMNVNKYRQAKMWRKFVFAFLSNLSNVT